MTNFETKTAWEIYLDVCNHMSNAELIPKDKAHQFVSVEDAQKEIAELKLIADSANKTAQWTLDANRRQVIHIKELMAKIEAANNILNHWNENESLEMYKEFLKMLRTTLKIPRKEENKNE